MNCTATHEQPMTADHIELKIKSRKKIIDILGQILAWFKK